MPSSRTTAVSATGSTARPRRFLLTRRNLFILAAAVAVLVAGYLTLAAGHASTAAVLLVIGYCILFPIGIAL
jgi:hypothetical protein